MKVIIDVRDEEKEMKLDNIKVKDLLDKLNINPVTVVVARNDAMVTVEDVLKKEDVVRIMSVVSGG